MIMCVRMKDGAPHLLPDSLPGSFV